MNNLGTKGKKAKYVSVVTNKDKEMLSGLSKVGYMSMRMLTEEIGLTMNRIKNYEMDGYIIRCEHIVRSTGNGMAVWKLTDKGKNLSSRETAAVDFYISGSAHHDLALAEKYFEVSEEYQCRWVIENEWRDRFYSEFGVDLSQTNMSPPDGGYITSSGEMVAIEVVTSSYTDADIASKEEFCEMIGATYMEVRI